jgi:hypothetical protein
MQSPHRNNAAPTPGNTPGNSSQKRRRTLIWILVAAAAALLLLYLMLPTLIKNHINQEMADMGDYRGHVEAVDLALWRGAYRLEQIDIVKVEDQVPVPFFSADTIDLSISWSALLEGKIVSEIAFFSPELNFVDGAESAADQAGEGTNWRIALQRLVPIRIDRLDIEDGTIRFSNFQSEPQINLEVTGVEGVFTKLSNVDRRLGDIYADFTATGLVAGSAQAEIAGNLDPLGDFMNFDLALRVTDIDLTALNDLTEVYGNFDIESGNGDFVMELSAYDGELEGYARPLLNNVSILDLGDDASDGLFSVAAEVEISGNIQEQETSSLQAFVSILRNAFVEAYDLQFGRSD